VPRRPPHLRELPFGSGLGFARDALSVSRTFHDRRVIERTLIRLTRGAARGESSRVVAWRLQSRA